MHDTLIIGAGLSGLQSALTLHEAGYKVLILEARPRIGGKTLSANLETGGCVELGAAWINDSNQHRMYTYAKKFKLGLAKQNTEGDGVMQGADFGVVRFGYGSTPPFPNPSDTTDLERIRDLIHDLSLRARDALTNGKVDVYIAHDLDKITLDTFVRDQGARSTTIQMVNLWTQVMLGLDSDEISAGAFIDYCGRGGGLMQMRSDSEHGGQYLKFRTGSQSVALNMASLLPTGSIHLSSPVTSITDHGTHVTATVSHADGRSEAFSGRKLILSIPTPLYKDITFAPPLPKEKSLAVSGTKLGFYTKVIAVYDRPWWTEPKLGLCGLFLSYVGPLVVARDTSSPADNQFSLTCFVNGSIGREWSTLPPFERKMSVLRQLKEVTGCEEAMAPLDVLEMQWTKEVWSQGAVCPVSGPGLMSEVGEAWWRVPVGNVHFVGTEFAREWKGYMEGALCSGEDGGREVVKSLRHANSNVAKL